MPHIITTYRKCGGGFAMTEAGASLIRWQDVSTPRTARKPPRRSGRNPRPNPRI
ncbi:MAG: hypothetical protein LBM98_00135 [Oscillospiraceae bacterium]|nr:hypothetical protein [Oscillospiraceae bacterium]